MIPGRREWGRIFTCHYFLVYTVVPEAVKRRLEYLK
jgi:hypothetical protein